MAAVAILAGDEWDSSMSVEGHEAKDGEDMQAFMNAVTPGYFRTLKTTLLEGRDFDEADTRNFFSEDGPPGIAIVNRSCAEHFFGDRSAVGRMLGWGLGPETKLNIEIVGVVSDSLYEGPREGVRRQVFIPNWGKNDGVFYVRARTASDSLFCTVRAEIKRLDPGMPVYGMKTVEGQLDETLLTDRLIALLSAGFGLLATLLASIGLYGVMAFVVTRRRKEIGIRLALGAQPGAVTRQVMAEVLVLLCLGLALGVPTALALGQYVASQLYGVQVHDATIAVSTIALLSLVAAAAGFVPAHRASRTDPILALRYE
jgi:predicted permease